MTSNLKESVTESTFASMDEVQHWVLTTLLDGGHRVAPRHEPTLERLGVVFTLRNPRRRCILNAARRWSLPLAVGEFCWHVAGSHDATFLSYYARRWADFAVADSTIQGSCYGYKAFAGRPSRWDRLVNLLRFDPETRRAVLVFQDPDGMFDTHSVDVACASTLQFLIRNERLHAVCNMRSNDAIWGLPYDVFLFTMLQELLACQLGLELGEYHHCAGSLHVYERHIELSRRILAGVTDAHFEMPAMQACEQLTMFLQGESSIRTGSANDDTYLSLDPYWRELLAVLSWFRHAKHESASESTVPPPMGFRYQQFLSLLRV